jgi:cytoskeletal protein RodZ
VKKLKMNEFHSKKIKSGLEDIAEQLLRARKEKNVSLEEASRQTGVRSDYLKALETADMAQLPAGLYGRNYLKEYANFLQIDHRPLLKSYDQDNLSFQSNRNALFVKKAKNVNFSLIIPKIIKAVFIIGTIALCALYLFFYLRNLNQAPELILFYPATDINTSSSSVVFIGKTEPETKVFINEEPILIDKQGNFSLEINLKKGLNTIVTTSQKRHSQIAEITRKILVE